MNIKRCIMPSFSIIGKEGSTNDGNGFIKKLWEDANSHFNEVAEIAQKDEDGNLLGIWGVMSDLTRAFLPWQDNFTKGLYLAGVQVTKGQEPPDGWVKWTVPPFEYICIKVEEDYKRTISEGLEYIKENGLTLVGAIQEYNCPKEDGQLYLYFPIKRL